MEAANVLGTDTDSIASMAGALLGAVIDRLPESPLQDSEYIVEEARRIAAIAGANGTKRSFRHPDPLKWKAPSSALDLVGLVGDRVEDGIDTFVFRDGLIRVQTVRYTLLPGR